MRKYRAIRDQFELALKRYASGVPRASGDTVRRLIVVRRYAGRERPYDHGNLVGGCKPLIDACVRVGLLHDDTPACCQIWYRQDRATERAIEIRIEEI